MCYFPSPIFHYNPIGFENDTDGGEVKPVKDVADTFDLSGAAKFTFFRDDTKKVVGLGMEASGSYFEGKKVAP